MYRYYACHHLDIHMRPHKGNIEGTEGKKHTPTHQYHHRNGWGGDRREGEGDEKETRERGRKGKRVLCMCFDEGAKGEGKEKRDNVCMCFGQLHHLLLLNLTPVA